MEVLDICFCLYSLEFKVLFEHKRAQKKGKEKIVEEKIYGERFFVFFLF